MDSGGNCHKCDEVLHTLYIDDRPENIARALACKTLTMTYYGSGSNTSYNVSHCDYKDQSLRVFGYHETCDNCPSRTLTGDHCAKVCPDGQYRDRGGQCHTCDDIFNGYIDTKPENIARILACPRLIINTNGTAAHCNDSQQSLRVFGYPETCAKCTNRELIGDHCAKPCPDGEVMDSGGGCRDCDYKDTTYAIDLRPENIVRAKACGLMIGGDPATSIRIGHCEVPNQIVAVNNYPETCNCPNRILQGSNCVK